jgi:hypothetical protein
MAARPERAGDRLRPLSAWQRPFVSQMGGRASSTHLLGSVRVLADLNTTRSSTSRQNRVRPSAS